MTTAELQNVEIPRNHWGQPMVMPPKGKKRVGYKRTTTFVGCLDSMHGLMDWKCRMVALGMGQRKDLVLAAAAANPDDKKTLKDIAEKATEHAQASSAATTGTALHSFTERIDRGQALGYVPDEYVADLKAYEAATKSIEWLGIESFRVHDDWKVAGTPDRIGRDQSGRFRILDVKTGSIDYPHKMAMQLAMYARMTPYDIPTDTRGADEQPIDLSTGIIIHLPAGQGICNLYEIDIARGWGGCLLAHKVWQWRAIKDLTHLQGDERITVAHKAAIPFTGGTFEDQARAVDNLPALRNIWAAAKGAGHLTPELRELLTKRSAELAA